MEGVGLNFKLPIPLHRQSLTSILQNYRTCSLWMGKTYASNDVEELHCTLIVCEAWHSFFVSKSSFECKRASGSWINITKFAVAERKISLCLQRDNSTRWCIFFLLFRFSRCLGGSEPFCFVLQPFPTAQSQRFLSLLE